MFEDFYNFTARPFQLTPDPTFYFESGTHRKALSYLGYGMAQGEGFIVVTGEVGAGKSALVAHLISQIDAEQITVGHIVTSRLSGAELVHVAAQSLGLSIDGHDKAGALGAIESFLHDEARAGRRCMLVVDESQNLSVDALEELRLLSNFQLGSHPLLQILLLGQPEFRHTLQTHDGLEQLRQRVIAAHHLDAMEAGELEPYVRHRLECAGWDGQPEFDPELLGKMFAATGGIPRKINQLMTRLLLLGAVEQSSRIDTAMLATVLEEIQNDNAFLLGAAPAPQADDIRGAHNNPGATDRAATGADPEKNDMLARRDSQIAELQQAVVELSEAQRVAAAGTQIPVDFFDRLDVFRQRIDDQERSVRQVLTMMIEWMESEQDADRKAA